MKIQILGTGCAKCNQLAEATVQAVRELNLPCEFEKVTDLRQIMAFGVMTTPALVVDGKVRLAGKIPSSSELKMLLQSVAS
jgi:small redox-active disulfide protein 2